MDQISKAMVRVAMVEQQSTNLIPYLIKLTYVRNEGAAFGLFPGRQPIFMVTSLLVLFVIAAFWRRTRPVQWPVVVALALVTGGAVGNLIDRLLLGYVTDFFEFGFVKFPVFNVADSCIVVGVAILMLWILFGPADSVDVETLDATQLSAVDVSAADDGATLPAIDSAVTDVDSEESK